MYKIILQNKTYCFDTLKEVMAKASEQKSGDILAGIAASSSHERIAAKMILSEITLETIYNNPLVPYEEDEITRLIVDGVDQEVFKEMKQMTVGELRDSILSKDQEYINRIRPALTAEMIAAVTKLMSNMDLVYATNKMVVTAYCNTVIGHPGTLSSRLQPNHPTDDVEGVMLSLMDGMSYGVGDAVIGLNPVNDSVENVKRILEAFHDFYTKWDIPTQNCVLAHVTTQLEALKKGAPIDLMFQSLAGSEISNRAFGIDIALMDEAYETMAKHKNCKGPNYMYFETGQGSELSSEGHHNVDQLTMEARCYSFAKRYNPYLVNTVVGFIGPEYLYDGAQVIRAGLEDHFMGKLTGISMGVDVCYTNHMKADQNDLENLALLLSQANCNYYMGVPAGDDVMLMYQSTSYHDIAALREITGKKPISEFNKRMEELEILKDGKLTSKAGDYKIFL